MLNNLELAFGETALRLLHAQYLAGDGPPLHFRSSLVDFGYPLVAGIALHGEIPAIAIAAKNLQQPSGKPGGMLPWQKAWLWWLL